jgi:hypothetical protein
MRKNQFQNQKKKRLPPEQPGSVVFRNRKTRSSSFRKQKTSLHRYICALQNGVILQRRMALIHAPQKKKSDFYAVGRT